MKNGARNGSFECDLNACEPLEAALSELSFGVELGRDRGNDEPLFQFNSDRFRHTAIIGGTGSGKSNHVSLLERQDIASGAGVVIIAAHPEDAIYPLSCIPEWRRGEVTVVDFGNRHFLPRLNPLDVDTRDEVAVSKVVSDVIELVTSRSLVEWTGPRFGQLVRMSLRLLLSNPDVSQRCLADVVKCLSVPSFDKDALTHCLDAEVRNYWTVDFPSLAKGNDFGDLIDWASSKFADFVTDATLSALFAPGPRTLDIAKIVDRGEIFVAIVDESVIGVSAAQLIRTWLTMQLKDAIMNRASRELECFDEACLGVFAEAPREELSPVFVYVDEFEKMADARFAALLAEARKRNIGFVLSFQNLRQLQRVDLKVGRTSDELLQALLGNVGTFVCYRVGAGDEKLLARQMDVSDDRVRRIERYRPLVSACIDNERIEALELAVPLRPDAESPNLPRELAEEMIVDGVWLPNGKHEKEFFWRLRKAVVERRAAK